MKEININKKIKKRFETSMIGTLARIEDFFGFLWGDDKQNLSPKEYEYRKLWDELRTEILNHCNYQMRAAIDELKDYLDYQNNLYEYRFIINNKRRENDN